MSQRAYLILCLIIAAATVTLAAASSQSPIFEGTKKHSSCINIESQSDKCSFVQSTCHGFSGLYLKVYYCSPMWKPINIAALALLLVVLFGAISVVASDFFCPNLQALSAKLNLSESLAGVTVLAFGNGSPDLFSTFSAMESGAGSLAIGELIGAAFFIVAIVSGSMGIIRPFKSTRITFMRDATFLTGAIMIMTWIVYHQRIYWYHGVALVSYYLTYVMVVLFGTWSAQSKQGQEEGKTAIEEAQVDETTHLLSTPAKHSKPPRLSIPTHGFGSMAGMADYERHLGHLIRPTTSRPRSLRTETTSVNMPRTTSTSGSISSRLVRKPMTPRVGIRTSLFGAIEFREHVRAIRRATSSHMIESPIIRQRQTSMPHWKPFADAMATYSTRQQGRPRASTVTDQVLTTYRSKMTSPTTPDSYCSSTGLAEDYFTYLSANNQNKQISLTVDNADHPNTEFTIPEIRLAPPNQEFMQQTSPRQYQSTNSSRCTSPTQRQRSIGLSASLHISTSPSIASTENELFVSACQSPVVSPSTSMYNTMSMIMSPAHSVSRIAIPRTYASVSILEIIEKARLTLLPTTQDWAEKSFFGKLNALVAIPIVLVFRLTLPVVEPDSAKVDEIEVMADTTPVKDYLSVAAHTEYEDAVSEIIEVDDTAQNDWCQWLLAVQAVFASTFISAILAVNELIEPMYIGFGVLVGCCLAMLVMLFTEADKPPKWQWMLSFAGFFVALNWIFLLANNMVGLLKAMGMIFNISDAIMGLTVFALGNSIGDLVANTAIAKMGFPTMAISACYAGPLLNMVLGVGISSTYQTLKMGKPYELDIAPTILVSASGLITVLLSTLIVVNLNGYHINKALGVWMICVYSVCCVVNLSLECLS